MRTFLKTLSTSILLLHLQVLAKEPANIVISQQALGDIGHQIFLNETGGNEDYLIAWNHGESFVSLGIGHFIWFPKALQSPFTETFPGLIEYMNENDVVLPRWLRSQHDNPWSSAEEFKLAQENDPRMRELKDLLLATFGVQLSFILQRMEASLPLILESASPEQALVIEQHFKQLLTNRTGIYSLVDYVNFKGEGISQKERYLGQGWGLKQVLLSIDSTKDIHHAFADACYFVLKRRVENSPQAEVEQKWLPGWKKRCDTYREF